MDPDVLRILPAAVIWVLNPHPTNLFNKRGTDRFPLGPQEKYSKQLTITII